VLTFEQLDAIYSSTHHRSGKAITKWASSASPRVGRQADQALRHQPWNGFEEFVRQRVLSTPDKRGNGARDRVREGRVPDGEAGANDRYAIGYSGLAYIDAGVRLLPVTLGGEAPQAPTYENVALATYP